MFGLWLIAAPFVFGVSGPGLWNAVIAGSLIALTGGYNWYLTTQGEAVNRAVAYSAALLGLWVVAAPFVFGVGTAAMWNDVIGSALVASFGGYNGYASTDRHQSQAQPA